MNGRICVTTRDWITAVAKNSDAASYIENLLHAQLECSTRLLNAILLRVSLRPLH
jgi:hypothetical protein